MVGGGSPEGKKKTREVSDPKLNERRKEEDATRLTCKSRPFSCTCSFDPNPRSPLHQG